ncbi:MAG: hypothetical protein ABI607_11900 [Betaproteobacteria bacterium]
MTTHSDLLVLSVVRMRSGVMIGTAVAGLGLSSPVFAANLGLSLPPQDFMLLGIVALLTIALGVRLMRRNDAHDDTGSHNMVDAPDLRWWRNSHA